MLSELAVTDLGVIHELSIVLGGGMTAVTGETGAGKTLVIEAIELLVGGRADGAMVRAGAAEAVIEGRFVVGDDEVVLRRVVPEQGRSRAYVDGRLATAAALAEAGASLVDLHGQHDHQSLLSMSAQRDSLDRFGGVDLAPLATARKELAAIEERLVELGGDERARAREIDLLRFQVEEIERAGLGDPGEDRALERREDLLADAARYREAGTTALGALSPDGGAGEQLATAIGGLHGCAPFDVLEQRLRTVVAEVNDMAGELRATIEQIDENPEELSEIRARRQLIHELCRKYGEGVAEVMAFGVEARHRLDGLEARDELAAELDQARAVARKAIAAAEVQVGSARREAAPRLGSAVQRNLAELAMPKALLEVDVGPDPGDEVAFRLAANPGSDLRPLAKVASGGELARTMLALRLVLSEAPPTLIFDEVDAGVGGTAATAVGRSLAQLGGHHQVLVVTHLPQVAAFADQQIVVDKRARKGDTFTTATPVADDARETEIARMLSGSPSSGTARDHARELLAQASTDRGRVRGRRRRS
ncbi:MAG: DNA repair protein RecN [Actinobacteria bacterium]|nr:DNA repair protein RecN [Actinomycetota bacterium]